MEVSGNTSANPYFYGTYLAATKPGQPALRSQLQAYQADAISSMAQLTTSNFNTTHTFRLEWQPGPGGRIDWFSKGYKIGNESFVGDGLGQDWIHNVALFDKSFQELMGSQIPAEPSSLILNVAISPTWGFPYNAPAWCPKCYDCSNPTCSCAFYPGFCKMIQKGVSMKIDSVRVYQTKNHSAHVGNKHTLGCDPPEYPTAQFIKGYASKFMRGPPFGYADKYPIKKVHSGRGLCFSDIDCGSNRTAFNWTLYTILAANNTNATPAELNATVWNQTKTAGYCKPRRSLQAKYPSHPSVGVCVCNEGYTGPYCDTQDHFSTAPSAWEMAKQKNPFSNVVLPKITPLMAVFMLLLVPWLLGVLYMQVVRTKKEKTEEDPGTPGLRRPLFKVGDNELMITGRSV